jgi:glycosyltransferase involved in cell wall biosynthesis
MMQKNISILVPVYNSSLILDNLLIAIDKEKKKENWNLELVLVDDGSKDVSFSKIVSLTNEYSYIKALKLSRNFGHQLAVKTGLKYCTGDYIAVIDDDLQDPPSLLPYFFTFLDKGYDVAYGVRKKRKENTLKKISYTLFYRILRKMSDIEIPLDTGDFCVMKKKVVENMLKLNEQSPFIRGIRAWVGFKQIGVEYERAARFDGDSGYTLKKLLKIAFDGIFSFSSMPIRVISLLGVIGLSIAFVYSSLLIYAKLVNGIPVKGFTTLSILILFFGSLTLICLGIIGEYIARIYDETRSRPDTIIDEIININ